MNILNNYLPSKNVQTQNFQKSAVNDKQKYKAPNSTNKVLVWYTNDIHGQLPKMSRLVSASQHAQVAAEENGADILKLSSGDTCIGADESRNAVASQFLNLSGVQAHTLGNHEFDMTASICGKLLKDSKAQILGMNLNFPHQNSDLAQKVARSTVVEGGSGEKYGIIGIQPTDLVSRIKRKEIMEGITVDDEAQTIKELQEEVDTLRNQGINKIFLISHSGNSFEKEIAQKVSGIDVIFGGHSHDLVEGIKQNENLFYSPEGEPVIITQAGRDGNNFGILNLEFNDKGQVTYVQNNVHETNNYSPNLIMSKAIDSALGASPVIGVLKYSDPIPKVNTKEENPWADFVADVCRTQLDADIALVNSGNFRGSVGLGQITERDISSIFPFCNKLYKVKVCEKDLVDAINLCGKTLVSKNGKPGLMQVSGLTYTLDSQGNLVNMYHLDKQGNKHQINVNNPDCNKFYTAVYDEFLIGGGDDLSMLKRSDDEILERYDYDKDKVTINYIKTLAAPFEVRKDGRITLLK